MKELYSKSLQGREIKIFIDDEGLIRTQANGLDIAIKGLGRTLVNSEQELQKLKELLEQRNLILQGQVLELAQRMQGGWGEGQHKGYQEKKPSLVAKLNAAVLHQVCLDILHFNENQSRRPNGNGSGAQGSYRWAQDIGYSEITAARLGYYSNSVDFSTDTMPTILDHKPQSWHFNTTKKTQDGTIADPRTIHTMEKFIEAVDAHHNQKITGAMIALGRGLHPLQDIFAHSPGFVKKIQIDAGILNWHFKYHPGKEADDPYHIDGCSPVTQFNEPEYSGRQFSQRYSDTKTATYLYLLLFRLMTEPTFFYSGEFCRIVIGLDYCNRLKTLNPNVFDYQNFVVELRSRLLARNPRLMIADDAIDILKNPNRSVSLIQPTFPNVTVFFSVALDALHDIQKDMQEYSTNAYKSAKPNVAELPAMRDCSSKALQGIEQCHRR